MIKISYLIPVYNSIKYLEDCYKSLLAQTYKDFSIIFIDDGSTDGSLSFLEQLRDFDSRITLIKTPHKGIVNALNKGIKSSKADWFIRLDADDLCRKKRTEEIVSVIRNVPENVGLITSDVICIDECCNVIRNVNIGNLSIKKLLYSGINPIFHPSVVIKRSTIYEVGLYSYDYKHAEDFHLWINIIMNYQILNINKYLIYYRVSSDQVTSKNNKDAIKARYTALESFILQKKNYFLILKFYKLTKNALIYYEHHLFNLKNSHNYKYNIIFYILKLFEVTTRFLFFNLNNKLLN